MPLASIRLRSHTSSTPTRRATDLLPAMTTLFFRISCIRASALCIVESALSPENTALRPPYRVHVREWRIYTQSSLLLPSSDLDLLFFPPGAHSFDIPAKKIHVRANVKTLNCMCLLWGHARRISPRRSVSRSSQSRGDDLRLRPLQRAYNEHVS